MSPKNVIMVLADQHQANMLGCAGHSQALTPNLDAFAASGVRFESAYCQNPICTPSRVSILSGQYCHNHGYYGLSGPTNPGLPNLMRHFKAHGYRTAGYGKLHLPDSPRNWLADDLDYFGDAYESADGKSGTSDFLDHLEALGLRDLEDSWHNPKRGKSISLDAEPSELPYEHTMEYWCEREAIHFIDQAPGTPFCIQIALQRPHHPLLPVPRFWELYPADVELPPSFDQEPGDRPPHFQAMWQHLREMNWSFGTEGESYRDGARRAWRGTLACVSQMDDIFGLLLNDLEQRGLADNTIVIYSSDHGGYHTMHGIPEKAPGICSDAVCRVPMIWHVPGVTAAGHVSNALVESVDMAPTLTALCGLPPMDTTDGLDISALLSGDERSVRPVAVTENPWSKSIRWGDWRLVHYQSDTWDDGVDYGELYNITEDPLERQNLYRDPEYTETVTEGRRLLLEWLIRTTRLVTSHVAVTEVGPLTGSDGPHLTGKRTYPLASDGRAPNPVQPRWRKDKHINYL